MSRDPQDKREWISFDDPDEERTWLFDVTFLESSWKCIYGQGCQGIGEQADREAHLGCCSHGAYFSDEQDKQRVVAAVESLTSELWQLRDEVGGDPIRRDDEGEWRTRLHDGACVLLNRPGFDGGPGCALHLAAIAANQSPVDLKPEVCWQVPIRREDHETETGHLFTMIREWARRDWGDGGEDFAWWCTEATEAFIGSEPVWMSLRDEIITLCGSKAIYQTLVDVLNERASASAQSNHPVFVELRTRG